MCWASRLSFRGALDVRATGINDAMKIAAANAIAELAREQCAGRKSRWPMVCVTPLAPNYIIPAPFDPRLMEVVPAAVAKAANGFGRGDQADSRHGGLSP